PQIKDYAIIPHDGTLGRTYQYFTGDVSYSFGHGLSYSEFTYSDLVLDKSTVGPDGTVTVRAKVTNTSARAGQAVPQLYAIAPVADGVTRPVQRLAGFEKISLAPRQSKTVAFQLTLADLWSWDSAAGAEVVDTGVWTVKLGASSDDAAALTAAFTVDGQRTRTLQQVYAVPSAVVLDLDVAGASIDAGLTAVANDQSFYDLDRIAVRYTSSDTAVAKVSQRGKVTGLRDGVATITATATADGTTESTTFPVVVTHAPPLAESITVDGAPLDGFDPAATRYSVALASAAAPIPVVAATAAAGVAVTVAQATAPSTAATVTVSDEAGASTVYTVRFPLPLTGIDFADKTPTELADAGWKTIRPNDQTLRTTAAGLEIDTEFGDLYQGQGTATRNLVVHDAPGDWTATVKITPGGQFNQSFQQGFIGVYDDDDNYLKIGYQSSGGAPDIRWLNEADGAAGQSQTSRTFAGDPTPPVWLRITKTGNTYSGYWSTDGTAFIRQGEPVTRAFADPQFVLGAMNGEQTAANLTVGFDGVNVAGPVTAAPLASYDFHAADGAALAAEGWTFIRPNAANVAYPGDGVQTAIEAGELFQTTSPFARNVLTHTAPGDWQATVKLDLSAAPASNYEKAVMGLYEDDDNFVLLTYQWDVTRQIELSVETDAARGQRTQTAFPGDATTMYLRLLKEGDSYTGWYSPDGSTWTLASATPKTFAATNPKLMLAAYGSGSGRTVKFSDLVVADPPPPPTPSPFESIDFRGKTRAEVVDGAGWEINRENPANIAFGGPAGLAVKSEAGGLGESGAHGANAANLLTHAAPGDWMATVDLAVTQPTANYQQALIGVYGDDNNYIKLTRSNESGGQLQLAVENNGSGASIATVGGFGATMTHLWLRLIKLGDAYTAMYSGDGVAFTNLGTAGKAFAAPRLMLGAYNDSTATDQLTATFAQLDVAPPPAEQINSVALADQEVELAAAQAGVQLAATVDATGGAPALSYSINSGSINTAGAAVTAAGLLTAAKSGSVRVTVSVKTGFDEAGASGLIAVIPNGSGSLESIAEPALSVTTARVGQPVSVSDGAWSVVPDALACQWLANGTPIAGATSSDYTPVAGDIGKSLSARVTASHVDFEDASALSAAVPVLAVLNLGPLTARLDAVHAAMAAGTLAPGAFTGSSWAPFVTVLAAAEAAAADPDASQAEIDAALIALSTATGGLVARGNAAGLAALLSLVDSTYSEADYTAGSWSALALALALARPLAAAPSEASATAVAAAETAMSAALGGLAPATDLNAVELLAALVAQIDALRLAAADHTTPT
ncbi:MAG: DUF1349 domain-containing protein, partial [Bifidobacteriaceae bacterium]|nr:DUF1349 domain-containing protein [Bifidobacteriaceae bacterium]